MKIKEIAKLTNCSYSTVCKILYSSAHSKKFRKDKVDRVIYFKNFEKLIDKELRNGTFELVCDAVINRASSRHTKKLDDVLDLAKAIENMRKSPDTTANPFVLASAGATARDIFLDDDFPALCQVGVLLVRDGGVRRKLMYMKDASRLIRRKLGINSYKK